MIFGAESFAETPFATSGIILAVQQSDYVGKTLVPSVPADGANHIIAQIPVQFVGCLQVTAKIKYVDSVTQLVAAITFRLTVQGGATPVQVGGTENPSALHSNIVSPPSSSMVVTPGTQTVDVRANNPIGSNAVEAGVLFEVEFLG